MSGTDMLIGPSGLSDVQARVGRIDALIRRFEPDWAGLTGSSGAAGGLQAGASFSSALQDASSAPSGANSDLLLPFRIPGGQTAVATPASAGGVTGADDAPTSGRPTFVSPLSGARLTQSFGPTSLALEPAATVRGVHYAHFHQGIDLAAPLGTPVRAAAAGTVVAAGVATDGAVIVRIRHADGSETLYGHLQAQLLVKTGDRVGAGDQLGKVGMTGNTTGPHLHFALYGKDGQPVDPQPWLTAGRLPGEPATARSTTPASGTANPSGGKPAVLAAPAGGDPGAIRWESVGDGVARFDAVASHIPFAAQIRSAALSAGVDPLLLASLVHAESDFTPRAVSKCGAMGLTQLMPATARSLGVDDPFDPVQNLSGGARFLAAQLRRFGRVDMALAAYQAGPTAVARAGGVPDYPSTKAYVRHITGQWAAYQERSA